MQDLVLVMSPDMDDNLATQHNLMILTSSV